MQYYSWTRISAVNHRRSFPIFLREGAAVHRLQADSPTTFRKSAISFRKNIDCETFRNVAFLLVFRTANGECSTSCRQKVRFAMFSCYFLRIMRQSIQVLCPVFSRKVFFRGVEGSNKDIAECESPRFCRTWRPTDFCSQTARNTASTARGNQWPVIRIASFHLWN